ncbi:hypothetical protein MNV49_001957 [Pseudohyphozyma bogoriensis]|nr:hypothetical protein MNV49_001957 [Pseudohyphozyma bogoriensis]
MFNNAPVAPAGHTAASGASSWPPNDVRAYTFHPSERPSWTSPHLIRLNPSLGDGDVGRWPQTGPAPEGGVIVHLPKEHPKHLEWRKTGGEHLIRELGLYDSRNPNWMLTDLPTGLGLFEKQLNSNPYSNTRERFIAGHHGIKISSPRGLAQHIAWYISNKRGTWRQYVEVRGNYSSVARVGDLAWIAVDMGKGTSHISMWPVIVRKNEAAARKGKRVVDLEALVMDGVWDDVDPSGVLPWMGWEPPGMDAMVARVKTIDWRKETKRRTQVELMIQGTESVERAFILAYQVAKWIAAIQLRSPPRVEMGRHLIAPNVASAGSVANPKVAYLSLMASVGTARYLSHTWVAFGPEVLHLGDCVRLVPDVDLPHFASSALTPVENRMLRTSLVLRITKFIRGGKGCPLIVRGRLYEMNESQKGEDLNKLSNHVPDDTEDRNAIGRVGADLPENYAGLPPAWAACRWRCLTASVDLLAEQIAGRYEPFPGMSLKYQTKNVALGESALKTAKIECGKAVELGICTKKLLMAGLELFGDRVPKILAPNGINGGEDERVAIAEEQALIVGSGEFGAATALSLIKGPYAKHAHLITILDRAVDPPAVDAASSDLNKIVRQDYCDPFYGALAFESIKRWRSPEWSKNYFESGVAVGAEKTHSQAAYIKGSLALNQTPEMYTEGLKAFALRSNEEVKRAFPKGVVMGDMSTKEFYYNQMGGWANARGAVVDTVARLRAAGVHFAAGEAKELIFALKNGKRDVRGVRTTTGKEFTADFVISTMGAWTPQVLPELAEECLPTGQIVATIQLTKEELKVYKDIPVTLFLDNGFYSFPPNHEGIIKLAIHSKGWLSPTSTLPSLPRTTLTPGCEKQNIPDVSVKELRALFSEVYPELAKKEFIGTRLCWYSDRPSGDWLLDYHPQYRSLFVCAGDSGHGFKFMPVIGDLIVKGISGSFSKAEKDVWGWTHNVPERIDGSRAFAKARELDPIPAVRAKL